MNASPNSDANQAVHAFTEYCVLNLMVAATIAMEKIEDCIKDLPHFGFDIFRKEHGILQDLIDKIPQYMAMLSSTDESFWSTVEGSAEYDVAQKKNFEIYPEKHYVNTW